MFAGTFTGDEYLAGVSPVQGTELCGVVELMYSFELLYAYTGDPKWAERLETVAFNALPATISDDMWAHQYDQQSNQICCSRFIGNPIWRTNGGEAGKLNFTWTKIPYFTASKTSNFTFAQAKTSRNEPEKKEKEHPFQPLFPLTFL